MAKAFDPGRLDQFSRRHRWLSPVVCGLFCLLLLAQLLISVRRLSQTADESTHLYAGYRSLVCRDFSLSPEHPPLARLVAAAPIAVAHKASECQSVPPRYEAVASLEWLYGRSDWWTVLFRARVAVSMFAVGLCILVWITARKMFGFSVALLATAFLVFEPNILAHGALVTTDMVLACMFLFAIFAFYLWVRKPSIPLLLLTGLACGLTLTAKQSGVVIVPVLCVLAVADAYLNSRDIESPWWKMAGKNLLGVVAICAVAAGVLWVVYGLRFSARPDGTALPTLVFKRGEFSNVLLGMRTWHLLPEAYISGLQTARIIARQSGIPVFLLKKIHPSGVWYFFPVAILVKFTAPVLALMFLSLVGARSLSGQRRREVLFIALPAAAFLLACMTARMNSGIRHALPIVPFILIFMAAGCVELCRHVRWLPYLLTGALALHVVSSLNAFPHYLSYANEFWGGPAKTYEYMPNNDWGEALNEVQTYLDQHPGQPCWIASLYLVDIRPYNLPCRQFGGVLSDPIPDKIHGTVIVSSLFLANFRRAEWLTPFAQLTPKARLGGSAMLVYEGDFETRELAGLSEVVAAQRALEEGRYQAALGCTYRAVQMIPESGPAHYEHCRALVANDALDMARSECNIARAFVLQGPRDQWHWERLDTIESMLDAVGDRQPR